MSRATSSYLKTLERLEKLAQDYLVQLPEEPPASPRSAPNEGSLNTLQKVADQLALMEETLSRSVVHAAGIENLLQTEADAFTVWAERLRAVAGQLRTWARDEKDAA